MPYAATFSARARRDLAATPEGVAAAAYELGVGPVVGNPHRLGKLLHGRWEGHRSARRGDFRVIYQLDEHAQRVRVVHIGYRGTVYRG